MSSWGSHTRCWGVCCGCAVRAILDFETWRGVCLSLGRIVLNGTGTLYLVCSSRLCPILVLLVLQQLRSDIPERSLGCKCTSPFSPAAHWQQQSGGFPSMEPQSGGGGLLCGTPQDSPSCTQPRPGRSRGSSSPVCVSTASRAGCSQHGEQPRSFPRQFRTSSHGNCDGAARAASSLTPSQHGPAESKHNLRQVPGPAGTPARVGVLWGPRAAAGTSVFIVAH